MAIDKHELFKRAFRLKTRIDVTDDGVTASVGERGELIEGFDPDQGKVVYKTRKEWERQQSLVDVAPGMVPGTDAPDPSTTGMSEVDGKVKLAGAGSVDDARERLVSERASAERMREQLTSRQTARKGKAAAQMRANCAMAKSLADAIRTIDDDDWSAMTGDGGILNRVFGAIGGQGQQKKGAKAGDVADNISAAVARLEKQMDGDRLTSEEEAAGAEDGNMLIQFICGFTDGLTEAIEGVMAKDDTTGKVVSPKEQFYKLWDIIHPALKLKRDDRDKILDRVAGYKQLMGADSDTLSGKGARKGMTRGGKMPDDPRLQPPGVEPDALIINDISGSVHSNLLAQELASVFVGEPIRPMEDSITVSDPELLDAMVEDALAMTAGGKIGDKDIVFHTAYEMLNGMQSLTGVTVSQAEATEVIRDLSDGMPWSDVVAKLTRARFPEGTDADVDVVCVELRSGRPWPEAVAAGRQAMVSRLLPKATPEEQRELVTQLGEGESWTEVRKAFLDGVDKQATTLEAENDALLIKAKALNDKILAHPRQDNDFDNRIREEAGSQLDTVEARRDELDKEIHRLRYITV